MTLARPNYDPADDCLGIFRCLPPQIDISMPMLPCWYRRKTARTSLSAEQLGHWPTHASHNPTTLNAALPPAANNTTLWSDIPTNAR